jgi:hypothetical protein
MKIVTWTPENMPIDLQYGDFGQWIFDDSPVDWNLRIGDMIQMIGTPSTGGTKCYYVTETFPYTTCEYVEDPTKEHSMRQMVVIESDEHFRMAG